MENLRKIQQMTQVHSRLVEDIRIFTDSEVHVIIDFLKKTTLNSGQLFLFVQAFGKFPNESQVEFILKGSDCDLHYNAFMYNCQQRKEF